MAARGFFISELVRSKSGSKVTIELLDTRIWSGVFWSRDTTIFAKELPARCTFFCVEIVGARSTVIRASRWVRSSIRRRNHHCSRLHISARSTIHLLTVRARLIHRLLIHATRQNQTRNCESACRNTTRGEPGHPVSFLQEKMVFGIRNSFQTRKARNALGPKYPRLQPLRSFRQRHRAILHSMPQIQRFSRTDPQNSPDV